MARLLVTYAQKNPMPFAYDRLYAEIKNNSSRWWHYLENVWIIDTSETAESLSQKLIPLIYKSDHLLVTPITGMPFGWMPKDAWDWLNEPDVTALARKGFFGIPQR